VSPKVDRVIEKSKMLMSAATIPVIQPMGMIAMVAANIVVQFGWTGVKWAMQAVRPLSEQDAAVAKALKGIQSQLNQNPALKVINKIRGAEAPVLTLGVLNESALVAARGDQAKATQIAQGVLGVLAVANPSVQAHIDTVLSLDPMTPLSRVIESGHRWTQDQLMRSKNLSQRLLLMLILFYLIKF
jgi:hypothetical protein